MMKTTTAEPENPTEETCLANLPIPLYGSVMGLTGLTIALSRSELFPGSPQTATVLLFLVSLWFVLLSTGYTLKLIRFPAKVRQEFNHPVRLNFFPAISISLLLLAIAYFPLSPAISKGLWVSGTLLHFILLLRTLRLWLFRGLPLQTFNPAWFIPVVGTLIIPIAGVQHAPIELSWFFFSIGLVFWIALLSITLSRIIFHGGLPPKLLPTLFILIAPPAVAFLAYYELQGNLDTLAYLLYFNALFTVILVLSFSDRFIRLPFFLSHWAYTFPIAAISLASFRYHQITETPAFYGLGVFFLLLLILVASIVGWRTAKAAKAGEFCAAED